MSRARALFPHACAALSLTLLVPGDGADAHPAQAGPAPGRDLEALLSWGDLERDGRPDLAVVTAAGALRILANAGEGRFEDVTERVCPATGEVALAAWADYDADGWLDLFVGARGGRSLLLRNAGGSFVDASARSGLESTGAVSSAEWLDLDGDGRLDLHLVTRSGNELYRALEGGVFERLALPLASSQEVPEPQVFPHGALADAAEHRAPRADSPDEGNLDREEGSVPRGASARSATLSGRRTVSGAAPPASVSPLAAFPRACADALRDQAVPGTCLPASSTPVLGMLHPISEQLFVAIDGDVGIGTTSPQKKLDVAGSARVAGTLTLDSGDRALEFPGGSSVYHAGVRFIHTRGGVNNTAIGRQALAHVTTGQRNTACGFRSLYSNTTGARNTASGSGALYSNTTGTGNTASGNLALYANTSGNDNTGVGYRALYSNTIGANNTACGDLALFSNTTGALNSAHGARALYSNTTGIRNSACGAAALRSNTTGANNTACGERALYANTTGAFVTASGEQALFSNTTGIFNTASGARALYSNTTGSRNTALGYGALRYSATGARNTACGSQALRSNTSGNYNTASGDRALLSNTTGSGNIALGRNAGQDLTTGSDNIAIGNVGVAGDAATIRIGSADIHMRTFIAGIRGTTTDVADAIPVVVDSAGQLGTLSSSRRFKCDIADMGARTERLLELRPVVFRYRRGGTSPADAAPLEYGLIAEDVAEVFPDLVVYDQEGQPFTVKYHLLSAMLLNELKGLAQAIEQQRLEFEARIQALESRAPAGEAAGDPGAD